MISALHHTMANQNNFPWDYRVEYFEILETPLVFNCGFIYDYKPEWRDEEDYQSKESVFQASLWRGFSSYGIFSFPRPLSTDQKTFGGPGIFCVYPFRGGYNVGGFGAWLKPGASWDTSLLPSEINTPTRYDFRAKDEYYADVSVRQGDVLCRAETSSPRNFFPDNTPFPILAYDEGGIRPSNAYVGTRFYEVTMNFDMSGSKGLKLRFVPCMKDGGPYICEMYSKTLIQNSESGSVIVGPKVSNNYVSLGSEDVEL